MFVQQLPAKRGCEEPRFKVVATSMEYCSVPKLRAFLAHCGERDMQITINRRSGREMLNACLDIRPGDDVYELSGEEFDKLVTYLSLSDQAVHEASNQVSIYSFVRIIASIRRRLRDKFGPTPTRLSTTGSEQVPGGGQIPLAFAGDLAGASLPSVRSPQPGE